MTTCVSRSVACPPSDLPGFFENWENELIPSPFDLIGDLAEQLWAASLIELQEQGVYEVVGIKPDPAAFQPERYPQAAAPTPPIATLPETPSQRHERILGEERLKLEALGKPYRVCVICEMPFAAGSQCGCGTRLPAQIVAPPPYPR